MSIVERALQKARAKQGKPVDRSDSAPDEVSIEPSSGAAPATVAPPESAGTAQATPQAKRGHALAVTIDLIRLREVGRLAPAQFAEQTEEEFRRVKWPLLNGILGNGGAAPIASNNVVLVTSATPGEGKTYCALNLALNMARDKELTVILVDGNTANPRLSDSLGMLSQPGLTEVLGRGGVAVADVVYPTNIEGMLFVPAGSRRDNTPELLAGQGMQAIVDALGRIAGHGVVVVDSPPLLATNDAQVISRYVGQVLMVVRADHTEQREVIDALALLDKGKPVSTVLNRVEPSIVSRYYGHYYYGYGREAGRK
jgi:receptor protein-tyrosine kinase